MTAKYDVFSLGNALVDVEIEVVPDELQRLDIEKGVMTLVEEDRHDYLLSALDGKQHKRASGGSAANTIFALAQLGGKAYHACKVAADEAGTFYAQDLNKAGVGHNINLLEDNHGVTGKCLVMITPDADRTMNTFLGISSELAVKDIDQQALKSSEYLYLEGYLVSSEANQQAAMSAKEIAKDNGIKIAFTLSDPNMVRFFKPQIEAILDGGVDLLFCNQDEAQEFSGQQDLMTALEHLKQYSNKVVITLGAKGALYFDGEDLHKIESHQVQAIDTNGAGDMFAGAFLYGLTQNYSAQQTGALASFASSYLVTQFGPRLNLDALPTLLEFNQQLLQG